MLIDKKALLVVRRLQSHGYTAYIVGGAVRDILLGQRPKDFDVVTDAGPNDIRKLFRNSRVIGRRFKLVHIQFDKNIIEVSTFRAAGMDNNRYGSPEEDASRRDFSMNALYYCPESEYLVDYVGGFRDIKNKKIRSIIPLNRTFIEDPVRMVRAIKYSEITRFPLPFIIKWKICRYSGELVRCSSSRITEEVFKILQSGRSNEIIEKLIRMKLLPFILPRIYDCIIDKNGTVPSFLRRSLAFIDNHVLGKLIAGKEAEESVNERFFADLSYLDSKIRKRRSVGKGEMLQLLIQEPLRYLIGKDTITEKTHQELFKSAKQLLKPITPPNLEVEWAVKKIMKRYIP